MSTELIDYFKGGEGRNVRAIPGEGLAVPIWILGSSLFGAQLAAMLGLPFALRFALRAGDDDGGDRRLSRALRAV